jgi:hypothetical protein
LPAIPHADNDNIAALKALNEPHAIMVVNADDFPIEDETVLLDSAVQSICSRLIREAVIPDYSI